MTDSEKIINAALSASGQPNLAAAVRALADIVVPEEILPARRGMRPGGTGAISPKEGAEDQRAETRRRILRVAYALDRQQNGLS